MCCRLPRSPARLLRRRRLCPPSRRVETQARGVDGSEYLLIDVFNVEDEIRKGPHDSVGPLPLKAQFFAPVELALCHQYEIANLKIGGVGPGVNVAYPSRRSVGLGRLSRLAMYVVNGGAERFNMEVLLCSDHI
jgi:hypothetical protein